MPVGRVRIESRKDPGEPVPRYLCQRRKNHDCLPEILLGKIEAQKYSTALRRGESDRRGGHAREHVARLALHHPLHNASTFERTKHLSTVSFIKSQVTTRHQRLPFSITPPTMHHSSPTRSDLGGPRGEESVRLGDVPPELPLVLRQEASQAVRGLLGVYLKRQHRREENEKEDENVTKIKS